MSRKRGSTGGKRSGLSREDEELWEHTARSLKPLKRAKARVQLSLDDEKAFADAIFAPKHAQKTPPGGMAKASVGHSHGPAAPMAKKAAVPVPIGSVDPRNVRKLRRGYLEIEGRIDLHGMRQAEAHAALTRFLISAAAQGKRWVLVITGKGNAAGRSPAGGDASEWHRPFDEPQRGVLKRNVPHWLAEPELRSIIVSFTEASIEHGGSGALYVHLRRQTRARE
jgi:DNA-nicking Smr family endonuclease